MSEAFPHLIGLLASQICFCLMLQFIEHAALGAVELTKIATGSSHPHPLLDLVKGIEANGVGGGLTIGGVERVIGGVLMVGDALLSTLGGAGRGDEIA